MPAFHFTIYRGEESSALDPIDLASQHEAWLEATKACGQMLKDMDSSIAEMKELRIHVTDAFERDLFCIIASAKVH